MRVYVAIIEITVGGEKKTEYALTDTKGRYLDAEGKQKSVMKCKKYDTESAAIGHAQSKGWKV